MTDFLKELAALAEKATPGPWQTFRCEYDGEIEEDPRSIESCAGVPLFDAASKLPFEREEANAALIVLLRNNVGAILALGRERDALREALKPFAAFADPKGQVPAPMHITSGSYLAKRQLTMGDCYAARQALEGGKP